MRNLKRVLSLGMTAAMISGLMVSAGAAGYTDVTAEDNVEAIEVLQAVGIMVGDEGGKFNPDQNVTRNEMAVIMSNLMDYRVATYAGTSPFTDVPSWAEPYVAACYTNGIVAGTSATTFGGNDTVTAGQAALMLMKALGYFQYQSDFGSDWLLATTQVATRINLFNGVEAGVREAMTRNDVAQLVLNTLCSTLVDAENNNINVDTGNTSITLGNTKYYYRVDTKGGSSAAGGVSSDPKYYAIDGDKYATGIDNATGRTLELGEELYEGDLKRFTGVRDTYGRPATEWKYELNKIGTYTDTPLATYDTKVSKDELYNLIGKSNIDRLSYSKTPQLSVYANGVDVDVAPNVGNLNNAINTGATVDRDAHLFERNNSGAAGIGYTNAVAGNGVRTEVYLDGDGNVDIVYINTYLMKATSNYNADKGIISVEVLTDPTMMNANGKITVTQLNDDEFENIKNFKEDDYILYTVGDDGKTVASVEAAKVVTGKVDSYSEGSYVTLDGTKYEYASKIEGAKTSSGGTNKNSAATKYRVGDTASVVVDNNGYVLYVDSAAISLGNYVYISEFDKTSNFSDTTYVAKAYFADGTTKEITLNDYENVKLNANTKSGSIIDQVYNDANKNGVIDGSEAVVSAGWYSYSVNSDGKYNLFNADDANYVDKRQTSVKEIKGGKADFAGSLLANENSVLIVKNEDKELVAYTGVKNFPTITSATNMTVFALTDQDTGYVKVAYVDASSAKIDDNAQESLTIFLKKTSTYIDTSDNEEVDVWSVIMDGEVKSIEVKDGNGTPTFNAGETYYKLKVDKDGFYEESRDYLFNGDEKDTMKTGTVNGKLEVSGSSLKMVGTLKNGASESAATIDSYIVTNDTQIVVVMRPSTTTVYGTAVAGDSKLAQDQMVDKSASWESKTVTGKQLDNMFGDYTTVYGTWYVVRSATDSNVVEKLYLDINGVQ